MFTMKKFAVLAIAGFFATSMFACSEDDTEDEDEVVIPPAGSVWTLNDLVGTGWTKKTTITVGGQSASIGSFLDIDGTIDQSGNGDVALYTASQVSSHKDQIDLIYDGTNLWTPTGCINGTGCALKSNITGSVSTSAIYDIPASVQPSTAAQTIFDGISGYTIVNNVVVATKGIHYVQTSENSYALVLIGAKDQAGNQTLELVIGYAW